MIKKKKIVKNVTKSNNSTDNQCCLNSILTPNGNIELSKKVFQKPNDKNKLQPELACLSAQDNNLFQYKNIINNNNNLITNNDVEFNNYNNVQNHPEKNTLNNNRFIELGLNLDNLEINNNKPEGRNYDSLSSKAASNINHEYHINLNQNIDFSLLNEILQQQKTLFDCALICRSNAEEIETLLSICELLAPFDT